VFDLVPGIQIYTEPAGLLLVGLETIRPMSRIRYPDPVQFLLK